MKKQRKIFVMAACLMLSLVIGAVAYAGAVGFETTTPTFGNKKVADGEKVSGSITTAYVTTGNCEEAFNARIQADDDGWEWVSDEYTIYANDSGYMSYTLTPDAGTPMRLAIWNSVGGAGGQKIIGTIDYR